LIFKLNLTLALVVVISFPVSYMVILISGKVIRRKNEEIRKINDNYFSSIQQSLAAIRDIKSLGIKDNVIIKPHF
jgi:ATP-binding cassette subfamily B protein